MEETDHRLPIVLGGAALLGAILGGAATQIKKKKERGRIVKMKLRSLIAAAALCTLCVGQASALEYTVDAPEDYLFGTPTSEGTVYEQESNNVDRGKTPP